MQLNLICVCWVQVTLGTCIYLRFGTHFCLFIQVWNSLLYAQMKHGKLKESHYSKQMGWTFATFKEQLLRSYWRWHLVFTKTLPSRFWVSILNRSSLLLFLCFFLGANLSNNPKNVNKLKHQPKLIKKQKCTELSPEKK